MKKVISVVMCAVMLLCCACFAGCQQKEETDLSEVILEQLKNEGFSNAYIDESNNKKVFVDSNTYVYVLKTSDGKKFFTIFELKKDSDIKGILNAFKIFFDTDTSYYDGNYIFNKIQEEVKNIKRTSDDGIGHISENGYFCDIFMDGSLTYVDTIYLREK